MDIKTILAAVTLSVAGSTLAAFSMVSYVTLQTGTPGTAETGNTNISGISRASRFIAAATNGTAITATAVSNLTAGSFTSQSGTGLAGYSTDAAAGTGVVGQSAGSSGYGVRGMATSLSGYTYGGNFQTSSTSGTGVRGSATSSTGVNFGVFGSALSTNGIGVYGQNLADSGNTYGGYFKSHSPTGRAVYGIADASGGVTYGVYGSTVSSSGYGLFALGRSGASGTKSFRIDHPGDPENRYLMHYSAEGPEPLNIYRGTVKTNSRGEAWVQLPDYYESINKDPSYQLTVIENGDSSAFVQAKVALKIKGNRFKIRTSAPGVEVCWEVKAVRNDLWVRRNGAPVEVDKEGLERGKYLHPELYGLPASMGMNPPIEGSQDASEPTAAVTKRK